MAFVKSNVRGDVMTDETEMVRRAMLADGVPQAALDVAEQRWDTDALREQFTVHGFMTPFIVVTRKADNVKGTLMFTHSPRWYFNFEPYQR
jgi:hypothetical protein